VNWLEFNTNYGILIIEIHIGDDVMGAYKCTVCGYIYKPERGDWTKDIEKGTKFEDLPDTWKCPTCNQPKMAFVEIEKK
jgi:rubredoxin